MPKINVKEIAKAITDKLGDIAESVISKSKDDDKDKDKDKDKNTVVNISFDEEKFAKSLVDGMSIDDDDNDDGDDDDDYVDEYDEMNEKELRKACVDKDISVFAKTSISMMKNKLRKADEVQEKLDKDKENNEMSLEDKQKSFKKNLDKSIKELGLDPKTVNVEIAGIKKSQENNDDSPHKDDDDKFENVDDDNFTKAFNDSDEDDKDEALGDFLFQKMKS